MTIDALIILVGAFVIALPFSGFPHSWQTVFFVIAGVAVIALGIVVRRRTGSVSERSHLGFEENDPRRVSVTRHEKSRV